MKSTMLHQRTLPTIEQIERFRAGNKALVDLMKEMGMDYRRAVEELMKDNDSYRGRAVVRCFGSTIEAVAFMMRDVVCNMCELFGEPLNPLLREKSQERGVSTAHRIYTIYRLLSEFAPGSPLAAIPDERWTDLHAAIGIRNRILHPGKVTDMELSETDLKLVVRCGTQFWKDLPAFCHWCAQEHQRFMWSLGGQRVYETAKIGRNELCPCGSKKKYKTCCGSSAS